MVGDIKLSKKEITKLRFLFWMLWSVAITLPIALGAYVLVGSWWITPVIVTLLTVFGYSYCEWLIHKRQWQAENTVIRCTCSHTQNVHTDDSGSCQYYKNTPYNELELNRQYAHCTCSGYIPSFWTMSGRV